MTEPVAFYDPHKGFYWAQPTKTTAPVVVNVEPLALYTQRTWVGLTDDEIQKCWKAAIKLNNEKGNDITNQTFYHLVKIVEEELMEKNYG